jgi:hypothetical protein
LEGEQFGVFLGGGVGDFLTSELDFIVGDTKLVVLFHERDFFHYCQLLFWDSLNGSVV